MIALVDCWTRSPRPLGGGDDDDLLAAASYSSVVVIGDPGSLERAKRMGLNVVAHLGVRSATPITRHFLRRRLRRIPTKELHPLTIWSASLVQHNRACSHLERNEPLCRPIGKDRPFVLPLASEPGCVDAAEVVFAQAVLEAGGVSCLTGLSSDARQFHRARRRLSEADRTLSIKVLDRPSPLYISAATLVVDCGITPGGAIDHAVRAAGVRRVDAILAQGALSLAACINRGLHSEDFA